MLTFLRIFKHVLPPTIANLRSVRTPWTVKFGTVQENWLPAAAGFHFHGRLPRPPLPSPHFLPAYASLIPHPTPGLNPTYLQPCLSPWRPSRLSTLPTPTTATRTSLPVSANPTDSPLTLTTTRLSSWRPSVAISAESSVRTVSPHFRFRFRLLQFRADFGRRRSVSFQRRRGRSAGARKAAALLRSWVRSWTAPVCA